MAIGIDLGSATFSQARRHDGRGSPPVRSTTMPMGLENVSRRDFALVQAANRELLLACALHRAAWCANISVLMLGSRSSEAWGCASSRSFFVVKCLWYPDCHVHVWHNLTKMLDFRIAQCPSLMNLHRRCQGTSQRCFRSGKKHIILQGMDDAGRPLTGLAKHHPFELCDDIVHALQSHFVSVHSPDPVHQGEDMGLF